MFRTLTSTDQAPHRGVWGLVSPGARARRAGCGVVVCVAVRVVARRLWRRRRCRTTSRSGSRIAAPPTECVGPGIFPPQRPMVGHRPCWSEPVQSGQHPGQQRHRGPGRPRGCRNRRNRWGDGDAGAFWSAGTCEAGTAVSATSCGDASRGARRQGMPCPTFGHSTVCRSSSWAHQVHSTPPWRTPGYSVTRCTVRWCSPTRPGRSRTSAVTGSGQSGCRYQHTRAVGSERRHLWAAAWAIARLAAPTRRSRPCTYPATTNGLPRRLVGDVHSCQASQEVESGDPTRIGVGGTAADWGRAGGCARWEEDDGTCVEACRGRLPLIPPCRARRSRPGAVGATGGPH